MSQLTAGEALVTPACRSVAAPDHLPGEEATSVKVAVTERCVAIACQRSVIVEQSNSGAHATGPTRAWHALPPCRCGAGTGTSYCASRHSRANCHSIRACRGTWMYQFDRKDLEMIKVSIAGQTLRQAQKKGSNEYATNRIPRRREEKTLRRRFE